VLFALTMGGQALDNLRLRRRRRHYVDLSIRPILVLGQKEGGYAAAVDEPPDLVVRDDPRIVNAFESVPGLQIRKFQTRFVH
jgi:hypothetical protein